MYRHYNSVKITGLILLILTLYAQSVFGWDYSNDAGDILYTSYNPEDHGAGEMSTSIVEDKNGTIYVGNMAGLLKFDGESWSMMPETGYSSYIMTVAIDGKDNIWVASTHSVGYYSPNLNGDYDYHDITETITSTFESQEIGAFWKLYAHQNSIFLITSERALQWKNNEWRSWQFASDSRILPSWLEGNLYIHARGTGVYRLVNGDFELLAEDTPAVASGIIAIISKTDKRLLCATVSNGLFYLQEGALKPASPKLPDFQILHARMTSSGDMILSTTRDGIVIVNQSGQMIRHMNHAKSPIYYSMVDQHGTLWAAAIGTILKIPNLPLTSYPDSARDIIRHDQDLYYTNGNQLKSIRNSSLTSTPDIVAEGSIIWDIHPLGNDLLYGYLGIFGIIDEQKKRIQIQSLRQIGFFASSWNNPALVYTSDSHKVSRWEKKETGWQYLDSLTGFNSGALSIVELSDSKILISSENLPILLADWKESEPIQELGKESGLPDKFTWAYFLRNDERLAIVSNQGLYNYDSHSEKFKYDPILGNNLGNDPYAIEFCPSADLSGWILALPPTKEHPRPIGKLSFHDGRFTWVPYQLSSIELAGKIGALFEEIDEHTDQILWVGGNKKILRYNISQMPKTVAPKTKLTQILEQDTKQLYYKGAGTAPESLQFEFPLKSLVIKYAATPSPIKISNYQTRLNGFNEGWSDPHNFTFREFTSLPNGSYTFEVRAIDEFGRIGESAAFEFTIPPPWYRNTYAYITYTGFALILLTGLIRLKSRNLRIRNERLTDLVNQRTYELETQKLQLEKANKTKQNFLASMSHEIRNPLNGIIGIAQLLKQKEKEEGVQSKETTHLASCSQHLYQLLSQTLDYSSLEAGKLRTRIEVFNPCELLEEVIQIQSGMAQEQGITLRLESPQTKKDWKGDPVLLRQILINLVSNGIKYTERGSVCLSLNYQETEEAVKACFEVIDTGSGIPKGQESAIFEEFIRLPQSIESHTSGTGLGLTISSEMARLMGGSLTLDPDYSGGARFVLDLTFEIELFRRKSKPFNRPEQSHTLRGKHVLIADDMEFNRYISAAVLRSMGAEIEEAENGRIALDKLTQNNYDIAVLDISMPKMTGDEVVETFLKSNPKHTPEFIALSAYNTPDVEEASINAGFKHFIEKPLDPEKLKNRLKHHYGSDRIHTNTSLLNYLAANGPKSFKELQAEYKLSFKDELNRLTNALNKGDILEQESAIHKLLGLCRVHQCDNICKLTKGISAHSKQNAPKHEVTRLIELLNIELDKELSHSI